MSASVRSPHPGPGPTRREHTPDAELVGDGSIEVQHCGEVVILRPLGGVDRASIERIRRVIRDARGPVILDLDECVLVDPASLAGIGGNDDPERDDGAIEGDSPGLCIVSRRLSCRRLLVVTGISARLPVFQNLQDALQARILEAAGYGHGWRTR